MSRSVIVTHQFAHGNGEPPLIQKIRTALKDLDALLANGEEDFPPETLASLKRDRQDLRVRLIKEQMESIKATTQSSSTSSISY